MFKYADFAFANVNAIAPVLGIAPFTVGPIALPIGISFFTFHAISYVIDVYKNKARAERRLPDFALYILLFPAADRRADHPLPRHRRAARQRTSSASPTSPTACADSSSAWARRC